MRLVKLTKSKGWTITIYHNGDPNWPYEYRLRRGRQKISDRTSWHHINAAFRYALDDVLFENEVFNEAYPTKIDQIREFHRRAKEYRLTGLRAGW